MADHQAARPTWNCGTCGDRWPCEPARSRMLAETPSPSVLRTRMWDTMDEAIRDLRHVPPATLFRRFLSWTG